MKLLIERKAREVYGERLYAVTMRLNNLQVTFHVGKGTIDEAKQLLEMLEENVVAVDWYEEG